MASYLYQYTGQNVNELKAVIKDHDLYHEFSGAPRSLRNVVGKGGALDNFSNNTIEINWI